MGVLCFVNSLFARRLQIICVNDEIEVPILCYCSKGDVAIYHGNIKYLYTVMKKSITFIIIVKFLERTSGPNIPPLFNNYSFPITDSQVSL